MRLNLKLPDRKNNRIPNYDYSQNNYYFVTICLDNMKIFRFGNVINSKMILNNAGKMIEENLLKLPDLFNIVVDVHVVMPNHVHAILTIENYSHETGQKWNSVPTENNNRKRQLSISEIVQRYKIFTTNEYIRNVKNNNWKPFHEKLWQRSFYDHIVRCDKSLDKIREYILNNPPKWDYDRNNPNRKPGKYHYEM